MTAQRFFLGWDKPVSESVSSFILSCETRRPIDLSEKLIVVQTRNAGRILKASLCRKCAEINTSLLSCRIVEPPFLIRNDDPAIANKLTVNAIWVEVLRNINPADYKGLFPGSVKQDFSWALSAGQMIQKLRDSLSDGFKRISDIDSSGLTEESERWHNLAKLEAIYLDQISKGGLKDPVITMLARSENPALPEGVKEVILAAIPDPTPLMVRGLTGLLGKINVKVLVHAPAEMAYYFDDWGLPLSDKWQGYDIDIPNPCSNIILAESPAAESRKTLELIAHESYRYGIEKIAVGVPDSEVASYLITDFAEAGVTALDRSGEKLKDNPVYTLLGSFFKLLSDGEYTDFAGFIRHPDILDYLKAQLGTPPNKLLEELDRFQNKYLPATFCDVAARFTQVSSGQIRARQEFDALLKGIECTLILMDSFLAVETEAGIRQLLKTVYDGKKLNQETDEDARLMGAAKEIGAALSEFGQFSFNSININKSEQFELFLNILQDRRYFSDTGKSAIELEGWLELYWDSAPFMLVTGTNDGSIPTRKGQDIFVPDSLRHNLGLKSDDDYCARDAYVMADLIESRRQTGRIVFILAKLSQIGEPLKPSRLLFHCSDGELTGRAMQLFGEAPSIKQNFPSTACFPLDVRLPSDIPAEALIIKQISVTAFKNYIACPFRFYMTEVLGMEELSDEKIEMDALDFGTIVHHALQRMAQNADMRKSQDEHKLHDFLNEEAEALAKVHYGQSYPLHIRLQLDAAKSRLGAASRIQAELMREGWDIIAWETKVQHDIGGMLAKGRVDRIDRNRKDGRIRLIDYKTSDNAESPADIHLGPLSAEAAPYLKVNAGGKDKQWKDLQLPLYRILLPKSEFSGNIEAGYFNIPKSLNDTGVSIWEGLDASLLDSAKKCAFGIIRDIQALKFWPPSNKVAFDDFAGIFPTGISECVKGADFQAYLEGMKNNAG